VLLGPTPVTTSTVPPPEPTSGRHRPVHRGTDRPGGAVRDAGTGSAT